MKILYGVQGTGNGHITRARVMAKALKEANIDVDWIFSGRPNFNYFDMECFANYQCFRGLTFSVKHGKIQYLNTARQLQLFQLYKDIRSLDLSSYDLIISDFEPISAWAAKKQSKFSLGLSHQSSFYYDIPKQGNNVLTDKIMRWFAPVNLPLGVHWHHYNSPILPPIIERTESSSVDEKHILIYFPFQSLQNLLQLVRPFDDYEFFIYHPVQSAFNEGHIHVRPLSREGFQKELQKTSGVICGAGFELPSEALHLGKKLMVQPVGGQMEQLSNAKTLSELGLAKVCESFNAHDLEAWLYQYPAKQFNYPDTAQQVAGWLERGDFNKPQCLVHQLWEQVHETKTMPSCPELYFPAPSIDPS